MNNSRGKRSDKTRPDSPVPTLQRPCGRSPKRRGSLRFLPPLEVRPSSVAPDPAESRGAPPPPQDPSPLRGTLGSSLRSPAEGAPNCLWASERWGKTVMESQCGHFQETPFAIRAAKGETMRKGCWFGCFLLFSLLHVHAAELGGPSGGGGREACAFLSKPITWEPHTWDQVGFLLEQK